MTYDWKKMVEITVPVGINGWVYAGSVTINGVTVDFPIGIPTSVPEPVAELLKKFIALEEEQNKVPEQGAGGGGGSTTMVVRITDEGDAGEEAKMYVSFDKTFDEVYQALKNHIPVIFRSVTDEGESYECEIVWNVGRYSAENIDLFNMSVQQGEVYFDRIEWPNAEGYRPIRTYCGVIYPEQDG